MTEEEQAMIDRLERESQYNWDDLAAMDEWYRELCFLYS